MGEMREMGEMGKMGKMGKMGNTSTSLGVSDGGVVGAGLTANGKVLTQISLNPPRLNDE
jgi:hypothetical protein